MLFVFLALRNNIAVFYCPVKILLKQCHQQVCYQRDPNLDLDGIAALAVEVP